MQILNTNIVVTPQRISVGNLIQFNSVNLILTISLKLQKITFAVSEQFAFLSPPHKFPIFHAVNLVTFTDYSFDTAF